MLVFSPLNSKGVIIEAARWPCKAARCAAILRVVKGFSAFVFVLSLGSSALFGQTAPPPAASPLPAAALYEFTLAKLLAVEGSVPESLTAYEEAERQAPESAYVRLEHAQLLARVAQFTRSTKARDELLQRAAATISAAEKLAPENPDVLRAVGSIYLDLAAQQPAAAATAQQALEKVRKQEPADAASAVTLGQLYLDQRQPEKAAEVLRDLVTRVPQQRMAYALLVEALLRSDTQKEAESTLQDILGIDPGSLEARLTLADLQSRRGDHKAALGALRGAPEEVRDEPRLRRKIAWELYLSGDLEAALAGADAVLASDAAASPDGDSARMLKGLVLSAEGRTGESLALLDKIRESDPDNIPLAVTVAHLFQREAKNDEAAAILTKLADALAGQGKTKEERQVRLELGQIWLAAKEWERAGQAVAPLLAGGAPDAGKATPDDEALRLQALQVQVDALVEAKRWDDALALLAAQGEPSGQPGESLFVETRRAEILLRSGREAEGRKQLEDLAARDETAPTLAAAQSLQRVERYADSIPMLERLTARLPDSAVAHFLLGAAYDRTGNRSKALPELRRVLQIDPDFHAALNYLGYALAEAKESLDEALSLAERAVALEPDNGAYVDSLGWTYYQLGRHEQARGYLERAARLEPTDATLQEHLGDVYVALGQNDRARAAYGRALELGDDDANGADRAGNAEKLRHKLDSLPGAPQP
jgi:tetratricopeptide (TPR) repeat protein